MVCSHCKLTGHTYTRCPTITEDEKKEKMKKNKDKKEAMALRRLARAQEQTALRVAREAAAVRAEELNPKTKYDISNVTGHEVVLYWGMNDGNELFRFSYASAHMTTAINCVKGIHRIVGIPFLEVCENSPNAVKKIVIQPGNIVPYTTVFDMKLKDYEGTNIILDFEYKPKKNEMDQWKECALKSQFIIQQILKIVGPLEKIHSNYDNISPLLDMCQDVSIPASCNEMDKELAGVPSALTNIT